MAIESPIVHSRTNHLPRRVAEGCSRTDCFDEEQHSSGELRILKWMMSFAAGDLRSNNR